METFRPDPVAEQDPAHLDQIGRPFRRRHAAMNGLRSGSYGRAAYPVPACSRRYRSARRPCRPNGAAISIDSRASRVAEILHRGIAAAVFHVAHEGRTIDRRQHEPLAADRDIALGIAGMLDIIPRRRGAEPTRQALGQVHPVPRTSAPASFQSRNASGFSANRTPISSRTRSALASISASPSSSGDLVVRDAPSDEGRRLDPHGGPFRPRRPGPPAPPPAETSATSLIWHSLAATGLHLARAAAPAR